MSKQKTTTVSTGKDANNTSSTASPGAGDVDASNTTTNTTTKFVSPDCYLKNSTFQDALEDVHTRFILNLPDSELQTTDRIFFQLEQAWWFYEDWICDPHPEKQLPRFTTLKPFAQQLFVFSPLLPDIRQFTAMWQQFGEYKRKISNYGCILLTQNARRVLLCQLWNTNVWTFPSGKINQGEDGRSAAARETYEETGFDPLCQFGTTAVWKDVEPHKITWSTELREQDAITFQDAGHNNTSSNGAANSSGGKRRTCYICCGVPEDFPFCPVARKEVSAVAWHDVDNIPKKSYAVLPFLSQLRRWIAAQTLESNVSSTTDAVTTTPAGHFNNKMTPGKKDKSPVRDRSRGKRRSTPKRSTSRGKNSEAVREGDQLIITGLAMAGEQSGWSEEDMIRANEKILGRKIEYDGNPHNFVVGQDPHAFRVVGGCFLNSEESGGIFKLSAAPEKSKLQPLFRREDNVIGNEKDGSDDDEGGDFKLRPFFSDDGTTPWGELVEEVKNGIGAILLPPPRSVTNSISNKVDDDEGHRLFQLPKNPFADTFQDNKSISQSCSNELSATTLSTATTLDNVNADETFLFMTDAEITAKSQREKNNAAALKKQELREWRDLRRRQCEEDMAYIRQWVANLPKAPPTKRFGEFKLDADAIMAIAEASLQTKMK